MNHGVRRTTLVGIARTAGVSRMTVYRRFPDVHSLLTTLLTREFSALLQSISYDSRSGCTAREQLVNNALTAVRLLANEPLMRAILDMDAELLLPYITERLGATQYLAESVLRILVQEGHHDGSIRYGDTLAQVRAILLIVQSFVLSLSPATTDLNVDLLLTEFRNMLDSALSP